MNATSVFSSRDLLTQDEALALQISGIIILIINICLSSLTLIIIIITKQRTSTTSNRIMFYLNVTDLATAGYRFLTILLVFDYKKTFFNVQFEIGVQFITCQVAYFSAYTVLLLALDRYLHVRYLTEIHTKFTNKKVDILASVAFIVSAFFATALTIETIWKRFGALRFMRYGINIVLLITTIVLYFMTMHTMKQYKLKAMHKKNLQKLNKTVTMASSLCMFSIALFYAPISIMLTMRALVENSFWERHHMDLYFHVTIMFAQLNTVFNATMYLVVNRKAKKTIATLFNRNKWTVN